MSYNDFFCKIQGFSPYEYQKKVAELLLSGRNVILSVPTGAGKTWASVMPFLYAKLNDLNNFPQKMIYSLPMRTLANSIYSDIKSLLDNPDIQSQYPQLSNILSRQTGEYNDDTFFEKDIVFSTIDQTLSNFLSFPLSISHGQANINAGSIIGSYLVFDEFHLLDSKLSMATTIGMLRMLRNLSRVCIMTATLTNDYIQFLKNELPDFEVVSINDFREDVKNIKSLIPMEGKDVKKSIHICESTFDTDGIIKKHKNKTIVICNRVETAQRIFTELINKKNHSTKLLCIHSRYFDSDRKRKETEIKECFGKNSIQKDVILVATQVIEAGMDISCDVMFTEISPINSFLQRAGRCARFFNEYGEVYVCDVLSLDEKELISSMDESELDVNEIKRLNNKYLPYSKELCQKSFEALKSYDYIDETISESLVNDVLKEDETNISNGIIANQFNIKKMRDSWMDCDKKHYRETIRDIQSIEVVFLNVDDIHDQKVIPWKYETISVYKWSFIGWVKKIMQEVKDSDEWIIAKAEQGNDSQFDFDWQDKNDFFLRRLDISELKNYYDVVFVNNRYFDYNAAGLVVANNKNGKTSPLKNAQEKNDNNIVFKKDTFYQHNKALLNCYEIEFKPKMEFVFQQLNLFWGENIDWDKLIKIVIVFHDYGKLNDAWQKLMLEYQRRKINDNTYFEILAHTDYDETTDKELAQECKIKNKPPHAGIGAFILLKNSNCFERDLCNVMAMAIAKHHSINNDEFCTFNISEYKKKVIVELQYEIGSDICLIFSGRGKKMNFFLETDEEYLMYFFISRILRLCDQKATNENDKYLNIR